MRNRVSVIGGLILSIVCFFLWVVAAMDYGDSVAVGVYQFASGEQSSTLVLKPDHIFLQTRRHGSNEEHSEGTWRRIGQGGISFSKEFLVVSGDEPEPDGTTFSDIHKALGLFPSLRLRQYHVLWFGKTGSNSTLIGTYTGDEPDVTATLTLNADHSFDQTVAHGTTANHATGTWRQDPSGTIRFSSSFLKTSGESLGPNELASSTDPRGNNLEIKISMSEHVVEPVFYKQLLSR